ncbi:MAG TPA: hypothetical protein PKX16_08145, partial [Kiritimatiellia bacterium]|nr:hypothetical protein [Kiritimatiellia bacterium]
MMPSEIDGQFLLPEPDGNLFLIVRQNNHQHGDTQAHQLPARASSGGNRQIRPLHQAGHVFDVPQPLDSVEGRGQPFPKR